MEGQGGRGLAQSFSALRFRKARGHRPQTQGSAPAGAGPAVEAGAHTVHLSGSHARRGARMAAWRTASALGAHWPDGKIADLRVCASPRELWPVWSLLGPGTPRAWPSWRMKRFVDLPGCATFRKGGKDDKETRFYGSCLPLRGPFCKRSGSIRGAINAHLRCARAVFNKGRTPQPRFVSPGPLSHRRRNMVVQQPRVRDLGNS